MTEDRRENLIAELAEEFMKSIGATFDDTQKYAFIAGARSALVMIENKLTAAVAVEVEKLKAVNVAPSTSVSENLKILHAARTSALQDFAEHF